MRRTFAAAAGLSLWIALWAMAEVLAIFAPVEARRVPVARLV